MRYLFKSTYTPTDPDSNRSRARTVVMGHDSPSTAISAALSSLEISGLTLDALAEYQGSIGDEDTSEGWTWTVSVSNGEYQFEIKPFEIEDPVTKEAIIEWARSGIASTANRTDGEIHKVLMCVMGRWYWRNIDQWSSHDLKEQLHSIAVKGNPSKPYTRQTIDELATTIMEEVIDRQRDQYDEIEKGKPFGMLTMLDNDRQLWFDED